MSVALPLLERTDLLVQLRTRPPERLIPSRVLAPGEQYRFHFDMTKCIGCKCCVVACNEQNGNPAEINWRRVGEIEGGVYPHTQRWHLSMGCNHCVEPSCLKGCPVEAYTKDALTGIVVHSADACIGCQYCTWNCSYGVPQYNEARGVVGKCDMCQVRLSEGDAPACVNACPEGAIAIEIVNIAEWRADHSAADGPGMPSSEDSLSTTRITLPHHTAIESLARVDDDRAVPDHAHGSLVFMLVLTQLAVGALAAIWGVAALGGAVAKYAAIVPVVITMIALGAVTTHLGRPIHAYRALKGWRHSWLSREVLTLSIFAGAAQAYATALFLGSGMAAFLGAVTVVAGIAGVTSSAKIYMVPARPAWNLPFTVFDFYLTCAVLGPALVLAAGVADSSGLRGVAAGAMLLQILVQAERYRVLAYSEVRELRLSARLLHRQLGGVNLLRWALIAAALGGLWVSPAAAFLLALAAEFTSRYLFFTSVVPKNIAMTYLTPKAAA